MRITTTARAARVAAVSVMLGLAAPTMTTTTFAAEPAPVDPLIRFKEISAKAEAAYQARQYQAAIDAYMEAYGVLQSADVLYNVAYIYDHHLQRRELAQDFYRRVIRMPESSKEIMALSVKRLAELDAQDTANVNVLKPNDTPADPPPVKPPVEGPVEGLNKRIERDDSGPGAGPWVLVGLGGAAVVGAVIFGLSAQGTNDDFKAESDLERKRELESDGKSQALATDLLGIGGGLLVAGGLIWYFAASGDAPAPTTVELPPVRPMLTRDGIGIVVGGTL